MTTFTFSSIVLLFLFQLLSLSLLTNAQSDRLLRSVCQETRAPEQCWSAIRVDPRSVAVDLPELGQIVVGLTLTRAGQTKIKFGKYALSVRYDRRLYALASRCEALYAEALDLLLQFSELLLSRQYREVSKESDLARDKVYACEAAFEYESPFKPDDVVMVVLLDAIFVISRRL